MNIVKSVKQRGNQLTGGTQEADFSQAAAGAEDSAGLAEEVQAEADLQEIGKTRSSPRAVVFL
ncbi:MAG: hypothetical protein A3A58_02955 [Candidatus Blackburnbacteria bacterium RIFCSPLOWO2_01_FULL_41_27]|uniref:Uncharacterized protein n=1 Tax=Candidatus Blackburnbacteria bacterium RIFCSPLOWO2_01_FULL_41_27 TaxID=1797520 RepID=A0A1G1VCD8_9BACT|nr:MAG: hypothetical protein A3A58_02955 [Candidatus Blackburnbacteria bacterium RIFCSPLOWO2_01_FULL_41_27]